MPVKSIHSFRSVHMILATITLAIGIAIGVIGHKYLAAQAAKVGIDTKSLTKEVKKL